MESQNLQICLVNIFNFRFNYYFRVLLIYSHTTKKSYKSNNLSYSIFQNLNSSSMLAKCGTRMLTKAWKRQKSLKWSLCPRALTGEIMGQWQRSKTRLDVYDNFMVVSFSAFTMLIKCHWLLKSILIKWRDQYLPHMKLVHVYYICIFIWLLSLKLYYCIGLIILVNKRIHASLNLPLTMGKCKTCNTCTYFNIVPN